MNKVFYDAECPICVREIQLIMEDQRIHTIEPIAIQGNETILAQYRVSVDDAMTYLHVLTEDGTMLKGMPAVRKLYDGYQGLAIIKLANLPILNHLADWFYPYFARNRYRFPNWLLPKPKCEDGLCHLPISERTKKK